MAQLTMACGAKVNIDDSDLTWLAKSHWCLTAGYPSRRLFGRVIYLHHILNGVPLKGFVTDHIDRDKLNACRSNLRTVTQLENMQNSKRALSRTGISIDRTHNKYKAYIDRPGFNRVNVGTYKTRTEAEEALRRVNQ